MASLSCWTAWLLVLARWIQVAQAQSYGGSSALSRARMCVMAGGVLDMYSLQERCLVSSRSCPAGSVEAYSMCVAPEAQGDAREVALTVHVPCESCRGDEGMELSGAIWLGLTRLLRVPLQETTAGVLLMDSQLRTGAPLEYFTIRSPGEAPLASGEPTIGPQLARWDLFVAFRVHTSRIPDNFPGLSTLRSRNSRPLEQLLGTSDLYIFDFGEQTPAWVSPPSNLHADFKAEVRHHGWNERPAVSLPAPGPAPRPTPAPPPAPAPTPAPRPAPRPQGGRTCPCTISFLGNGFCEEVCNTEECSFDGGDCLTPTPTPAPRTTTTARTTTTTQEPCECREVYLRHRSCNTYCNFVQCGFLDASERDCPAGSSNIVPWQITTTTTAPAPAPTAPAADSPYSWLNAPRQQPAPSPPPSFRGSRVTSTEPPHQAVGTGAYSLHVEPDGEHGPNAFRVVASEEPDGEQTWVVDPPRDEGTTAPGLPLWLIIVISTVALTALAFVCVLARKPPPPEHHKRRSVLCEPDQQAYWCHSRMAEQEAHAAFKSRKPSKCSDASTSFSWPGEPSESSQDSWEDYMGRSPSGSKRSKDFFDDFVRRSPSDKKRSKVYPEPEPEDVPVMRNTKGGWRAPGAQKKTPSSGRQAERRTSQDSGAAGRGRERRRSRSNSADATDSRGPKGFAAAGRRAAAASAARQAAEPEPEQEGMPWGRSRSEPVRRETERPGPWQASKGSGQQAAPEASAPPPRRQSKASAEKPAPPPRPSKTSEASKGSGQEPPRERPPPPPRPAAAAEKPAPARAKAPEAPKQRSQEPGAAGAAQQEKERARPQGSQRSEPQGAKESGGGLFSRWFGRADRPGPEAKKAKPQESPKQPKEPPKPAQKPAPAPKPAAPKPAAPPKTPAPRPSDGEKRSTWSWGQKKSAHVESQPPKEKDPEKHANSMVGQVLKDLEQMRGQPLETRKRVFKDWQRRLHPDKNLKCPEAAKLAFQQLMDNRASFLAP